MPWYPKAVRKQLTVPNRARNKSRLRPVRINLHTAVSNSGSLFGFFNSSGARGVFSHFYVTKTGGVEQYQNTDYMASCDLDGNSSTISIETWDGYRTGFPGYWKHDSDVPPWNDSQQCALRELIDWILDTHPSIPRRLAKDNRNGPSSHGLSWHRLGVVGAPGVVSRTNGGLIYSLSRGKVCPGTRRTNQIPSLLAAKPADTRTEIERLIDDMDTNDLKKLIRDETAATIRELVPGIVYLKAAEVAKDREKRDGDLTYVKVAEVSRDLQVESADVVVRRGLDALAQVEAARAATVDKD